jgi:hypothetical protein
MSEYIQASTAEPVKFLAVDSNGAALTGVTDLLMRVERGSDGFFYDFNDSTFKTPASVTTITATLSAVSATYAPGLYSATWPGGAAGTYYAVITQTGSTVSNVPAIACIRVAELATATALAAVQADTDDIQTRLPAALVSGRIDASVGAMAANTVTSSAIATDAIGSAQLASSAVTEIQSGLATSSALATVQADTDDIQTRLPSALVGGRIDASVGAVAANAITASAIATDAIGSAQIATSAVTEIQTGLATSTALASVQTDTTAALARLPSALVGGKMDSHVNDIAANAITATSIATDAIGSAQIAASAVTEIQSGLATSASIATLQADTDDIQTRLPAALVAGRIDASVGAVAAGAITATAIATDAIGSAQIAASAVTEIQAGLATASALAGVQADTDDIQARLPAALVSGRMDSSVGAMAANVVTAAAIATDAIDADAIATDAVTEIQSGLATSAAVAALPTASSNATALLDAALSGHTTTGTAGKALSNADALTSSRAVAGDAMTLTTDAVSAAAVSTAAVTKIQAGLATSTTAADVWTQTTRQLTGIGSSGIASQASVSALPSASSNASTLLDSLLSGHTTAGSVGLAIGYLDAAISGVPASVASTLAGAHGTGSWATATGFAPSTTADDVWASAARTLTGIGSSGIASQASVSALPSAATIASAAWDEALSGHTTAGSAGAALSAAGTGSAPSAGTVAAAVWALSEGTPAVGTYGYAAKLGRQHITNRLVVSTTTNGTSILYADDGTTPLVTQTLRDGANAAITTPTGSPAQRSAAA